MALTATITTPVATVQVGYQISAFINVANSGGSDIVLLRIVSRIRETGNSFSFDANSKARTAQSITQNPVVPAGGSSNYTMKVVFHAPSLAGTYDLGCDIYSSDGQLISPTPATITVTIPPGDIGA